MPWKLPNYSSDDIYIWSSQIYSSWTLRQSHLSSCRNGARGPPKKRASPNSTEIFILFKLKRFLGANNRALYFTLYANEVVRVWECKRVKYILAHVLFRLKVLKLVNMGWSSCLNKLLNEHKRPLHSSAGDFTHHAICGLIPAGHSIQDFCHQN